MRAARSARDPTIANPHGISEMLRRATIRRDHAVLDGEPTVIGNMGLPDFQASTVLCQQLSGTVESTPAINADLHVV